MSSFISREVEHLVPGQPASDGAGVRLLRLKTAPEAWQVLLLCIIVLRVQVVQRKTAAGLFFP